MIDVGWSMVDFNLKQNKNRGALQNWRAPLYTHFSYEDPIIDHPTSIIEYPSPTA